LITAELARKELLHRRAKRELARRSVFHFLKYTFRKYRWENWHHKVVADFYRSLIERKITRGIVMLPPRHSKTEGCERAMAWAYGKTHYDDDGNIIRIGSDEKIIHCSATMTRARKTSINVKRIVKDNLFTDVFPNFMKEGISRTRKLKGRKDIKEDQSAYWELGEGARGSFLAAGLHASIMGEGFTIGNIDDPTGTAQDADSPTIQEMEEEWFTGTFLDRQDDEDSAIMLTMQRWGIYDMIGRRLYKEGMASYNTHKPQEGVPEWNGMEDGEWHVLCLPRLMDEEAYEWKHPDDPREIGEVLWPQRYPLKMALNFKKNVPVHIWEAKHQQRPKVRGGNLINREWFGVPLKDFPRGGKIVRFWDLASTPKEERKKNNPDYTAGALLTYVGGIVYVIDLVATQIATKQKYDLIKQTAVMDDLMYGSVMQIWEEEGGSSGKDVTVTLNELLDAHLRSPHRVRKNKNFYVELFANKAETGNVRVIEGPWLHRKRDGNTFYDSAEAFPSGVVHDDDIDATSKGCFILTSGILKNIIGSTTEEEEHKSEKPDEEVLEKDLSKILEHQLKTLHKIDESQISDYEEAIYILEQLSNKYIELNDSDMAEKILDEIDRIEILWKSK
jgi:phage terminase large subunit-like protein